MSNCIGVYFSGTGNTRYCVERFLDNYASGAKANSIEHADVLEAIANSQEIVFGFPIYYSHAPKIVRDFITQHGALFNGKKIFIITTKGLFNAYAVIYARRAFKKCGARFWGSLQINMPDNIRDLKIMQLVFNYEKDPKIIAKAEKKIDKAALKFKSGKKVKSGTNILNYIIGFFFKILFFYPKTNKYKTAPKVHSERCNGCGLCAEICPKKNITMVQEKAAGGSNCTLCYRCFGRCPQQALTVLGKKVYGQYYLNCD